jgi:hypothetical protein
VLAAIEHLAIGQRLDHRIDRFDRVVAIDACLGGGGAEQPVALEEFPVAEG